MTHNMHVTQYACHTICMPHNMHATQYACHTICMPHNMHATQYACHTIRSFCILLYHIIIHNSRQHHTTQHTIKHHYSSNIHRKTIHQFIIELQNSYITLITHTHTHSLALLRNVLTTYEKGRPCLIGTTSVESSEEMVQALRDLNIPAQVRTKV